MYENKRKPSPENCYINYVVLSGKAFLFTEKLLLWKLRQKSIKEKVIPF